ncbi:hypothetical protein CPB86DRAFT_725248 [Serendipita vermifera]|nr:hypothetical protein CPB86DRAFT_725248 [Serendipita vermifera]
MQKLESVNKQVSECERKNVDLQRRLVKSPERVKSNISDMGDEVVKKKGQVQALEDLNRAFRSKVDRLNDIIANNKAIKAHLVTIEDVLKEKGTQASLVHSMMEDIKKLKIDHKDELDKKDTWEKKGEAARDRIATFESRASNERKVLAEKTQEVNEEYERATRERSEGDHRFDEGKEMAMELEREIATMIADTERAIREALGDYWRMMKQADEYISVIAKRLQLPLPTS